MLHINQTESNLTFEIQVGRWQHHNKLGIGSFDM
jgi:hypothetical protein